MVFGHHEAAKILLDPGVFQEIHDYHDSFNVQRNDSFTAGVSLSVSAYIYSGLH